MKEGSDEPAPRNELRKFVLNPSFYQARLKIREAKVKFFIYGIYWYKFATFESFLFPCDASSHCV